MKGVNRFVARGLITRAVMICGAAAGRALAGSVALLVAAGLPAAAQSATPVGTWLTEKGDAQIRIAPCGGALCGRIVGLREPLENGAPVRDTKNPNPARRNNPLVGTTILISMAPAGASVWKGRIYNAEDGGLYEGTMALGGATTLKVEGCLMAFCGGETWTRIGGAPAAKGKK